MKNGKHVEGAITRWYKNDLIHRINGPATIAKNGSKRWYQNGLIHRVDAPACFWNNGNLEWYFEGQRHCETGPALILPGRLVEWYLFGVKYTEEDFNYLSAKLQLTRKLNENLPLKGIIKKLKI